MSVNAQLTGWLLGFPEREAPVFVWPACPISCNPVVYSLCFVWVTKATVHTHLQEKRAAETSRDDHGNTDPGRHLTPQRNADVTLQYFFQGLLARAQLSSNQECDQVNLCTDLITHTNHIMGGKAGKIYILWTTLVFRGGFFWLWCFSVVDCFGLVVDVGSGVLTSVCFRRITTIIYSTFASNLTSVYLYSTTG